MERKYQVGIIGGGGYTAGELLRILAYHPAVELKFVVSQSQAGRPVSSVHRDLVGEIDLHFVDTPATADVIFLCMGHGKSKGWVDTHQPSPDTLIVDLSSDYRLDSDWVYGLPELNRATIQTSKRIANPGCFATAIQLAALPLAGAGLLKNELHVNAITGSTGAGQNPSATTHFSWRNNNISVYKAFRHQHLHEIKRSLAQAGASDATLHFLPVRGNFTRGIFASAYVATDIPQEELSQLYAAYYAPHPFTHLVTENPNLKQVVNTNKALVYVEQIEDQALVISLIDNLLKGASGQAVQNMNIALGLAETTGLHLKASAF